MTNSFSIRGTLREANQLMKPHRWNMVKQYALIAFVFPLALLFLFGKGAYIGAFIALFISINWSLSYVNKGSFDYNDLFENFTFKDLVYFFCALLLVTISVIGGLVLLIIPGLIFLTRLSFAKYIAIEKKLSPMAALRESKRITKGHRWKIFLFLVIMLLINILGLICLIVGVFFTAPLTRIAHTILYKKLSQEA